MPDLYPKFDMPDLVEAVEDTSIAYPKSWLFDFDTGDFVLDGAGNVVEADGLTTWAQWCVKAVLTQRLAFVVYNWDYGVDIENVMKQPTRAVTEAELEKEITEALMTDPRTAEVKNFTFEWSGDELTVSFIIVNAAGVPAEIRVGVGYREVMREFSISKVEQTISDWLRGELVNVEPTENGELVIKSVAQPTFTRNSIAYKSDGSQVAENVPRFEAGKFGQGIMIEEGTTNLFPLAKSVVVSGGSDPYFFSITSGLVQGGTYTLRALIKAEVNDGTVSSRMTIKFNYSDGTSEIYTTGQFPKDGIEREYVLTKTANAAKTLTSISGWILDHSNPGTGKYQSARNIQLEQKPYATSFTDGTRAVETLTIPTAGVLNPQKGTVEFWVKTPSMEHLSSHNSMLFTTASSTNYNNSLFGYWLYATRKLRMLVGTGTSYTVLEGTTVLQPNTWYYIVFKWTSNSASIYLNGQLEAQRSLTPNLIFSKTFRIGCTHVNTEFLDSLIDDLRISSRARTDAEILSAYQSNQPLPIDENTTYALRFDNNLKVGRGGYRRNKIYLQSLGICQGSHIEWSAEIPTNTTAKVYTSLDDVNFTEAVNGAAIEGLSEGVSLSDKALMIKQIMTTEDASITPMFSRLQYSISGKVYLRG